MEGRGGGCELREIHCPNTAAAAKSLQSCRTLCDPVDSSPPASTVHGIFQARVLEWVAIAFSGPNTEASSIKSNFSPDYVSELVQIPDNSLHLQGDSVKAKITDVVRYPQVLTKVMNNTNAFRIISTTRFKTNEAFFG